MLSHDSISNTTVPKMNENKSNSKNECRTSKCIDIGIQNCFPGLTQAILRQQNVSMKSLVIPYTTKKVHHHGFINFKRMKLCSKTLTGLIDEKV